MIGIIGLVVVFGIFSFLNPESVSYPEDVS
jgi:hypothetical protein